MDGIPARRSSILIKSGSNALPDGDLNARSFFDLTGSASVSKINIYSFEVGGPIYVPKLFSEFYNIFNQHAFLSMSSSNDSHDPAQIVVFCGLRGCAAVEHLCGQTSNSEH